MLEGLFQPMHLIIILFIVLFVFGPGKLSDVGGALGKAIRGFKQAVNEPEKNPEEVKKLDYESKK
jgi:sec-independent protein translocase protein TatA